MLNNQLRLMCRLIFPFMFYYPFGGCIGRINHSRFSDHHTVSQSTPKFFFSLFTSGNFFHIIKKIGEN